ncbi:hypothetical protein [Hansschlegelia zhihuaiae]|uniref:Uncharacterized protein n=1 Tax=Hansschlegelia zhihuaiae TaxID=405005 RepID=A0A4Q0MB60_9HYPH|nr:hypothetical protein [Hansschlegelia zhihuaiae]RXF70263.1 hypothetical protein EK403_17040 [Hansschlegelia zhihuaiae]
MAKSAIFIPRAKDKDVLGFMVEACRAIETNEIGILELGAAKHLRLNIDDEKDQNSLSIYADSEIYAINEAYVQKKNIQPLLQERQV